MQWPRGSIPRRICTRCWWRWVKIKYLWQKKRRITYILFPLADPPRVQDPSWRGELAPLCGAIPAPAIGAAVGHVRDLSGWKRPLNRWRQVEGSLKRLAADLNLVNERGGWKEMKAFLWKVKEGGGGGRWRNWEEKQTNLQSFNREENQRHADGFLLGL